MSSQAWKDLERRACLALGGRRRHSIGPDGGWASGSDDDGTGPFSIECKRTSRYQIREAWVDQARRQGRQTSRPWVLVIGAHHKRDIAVTDLIVLAQLAQEAGRIPTPMVIE